MTFQKGEAAYKTDEPAEEGGGRHPLLLAQDQGRQCDRQVFTRRLPRLFHPLQRGLLVLLRPGGVNCTHTQPRTIVVGGATIVHVSLENGESKTWKSVCFFIMLIMVYTLYEK